MPKVNWHELNDQIHGIKGMLNRITGIEIICKQLKKDMLKEIDNLHKIVLKQVDNENNNHIDGT